MPRTFIHFTFLFFTLTALSGVWMRYYTISPNSMFSYTYVLHGHSHLSILGWAFLGGFLVFLSIFWQTIRKKRQAILLTLALTLASVLMFGAFLYQGYGVFSIVMSTIHIFIEYWAAVFIYRQLKNHPTIPKIGKAFINASLVALVLSSIGPFSLGFISANGLKDSYLFDMALYFYLHFQYNGWLTLFLLGTFISIIHTKRIPIHSSSLYIGFWIYLISLFPSYFLSVLWVDLGTIPLILGTISGIGQWIGILFILLGLKRSVPALLSQFSTVTRVCLWFSLILLFSKSTMELGLLSPSLANLVYDTRSIVIGYLHLTLLGFVSLFILTQYQLQRLIPTGGVSTFGLLLFFSGFALNELLLFSQGLLTWLKLPSIPIYPQGLLIASLLLLFGICSIWYATTFYKRKE